MKLMASIFAATLPLKVDWLAFTTLAELIYWLKAKMELINGFTVTFFLMAESAVCFDVTKDKIKQLFDFC